MKFKIKQLGIDGNVHNLIQKLQSSGKQRVVINSNVSDWEPVTNEFPQGSVLGPVLLIVYINDVDVGLNNFIAKFADDTRTRNSIITDNRMSLQKDLRKFS